MPRRSKAALAGLIMLGSVGLASAGLLPIAISALAGAILMFITGCVKFDRVGRALSAQVIVLVNIYNISIWLVGLGMGLIIMTIAVFVELRREQLRARTREWSETLEKWE